jgi:mono/diheme cytochrome c family protein
MLGTADDVAVAPAPVTVPTGNPRAAIMDLSGVSTVADTYRVTLVGTGPATILDLAGNALDGEPTPLPSGDGVAGGNYTATFTVAAAPPTLTSIQTDVFTPRCSGCHNGVGAMLPGAMNLTSVSSSYAALVGVASLEVPTLQRVAAGNPNDSYLVRKLEGAPGIVGSQMPLGGPFLSQATIDSIRQWIANGAAQ